MAKKKLELIENISGWGMTLDMINDGFDGVTENDTVVIPINSYGGSVMEGTAVYNVIKGSNAKTEAHILGYAMSMGTVIASAADEVVMPKNGYYMIHEPSMIEWGDAETFKNSAAFLNTIGMDAAKIYSEKTGLSVDAIRAMMKKTTWMNAEKALELGFVDRLSEGTEINASLDPKLFKNAPTELLLIEQSKEKSFMQSVAELLPKSFFKLDSSESTSPELETLQAQLQAKTDEAVSLQAKLTETETSYNTAKSTITQLESDIQTKDKRITELEAMDSTQQPGGGGGDHGQEETKLYLTQGATARAKARYEQQKN